MRSVLTAAVVALGLVVLPTAAQAAPAAKTPAAKCAEIGYTKGIFITQASGAQLCLVAKGTGSYIVDEATGCGPLSKGGKGYLIPGRGKNISCNAWVNIRKQPVGFVVQ